MSIFKYIAQIATYIGKNNDTAPASDTAASGLNGRLQRIAQNLSTANTNSTATNTKLDTANTNSEATNTKLDTLITAQNATNTKLDTIIAALNTANGLLLDIYNKP